MPRTIDIDTIFGPDGRLSKRMSGYEQRPQQTAMAEQVATAFTKSHRVVVEAATGTGKTVAYLVPAILSGRRTVVSTATKTLQDQIFTKDLPMLAEVLPKQFSAVLLKGRTNYLCWWQYENFRGDPRFRKAEDRHWWPAIQKWAAATETGDRAEIRELPDDWGSWADLSIGGDGCLGRECDFYDRCFVMRARQQAADADVVVVNHHLYFADLSLRTNQKAELLPSYEAVVFDEAHNLEEVAASWFGVAVSSWRIADLLGDILRFLEREQALTASVTMTVADTRDRSNAFWGTIKRAAKDEPRIEYGDLADGAMGDEIEQAHRALEVKLGLLGQAIEGIDGAGEIGTRLVERVEAIQVELALLVHREAPDLVYMAEVRGRGVFLQAFPIDVSPILRDLLYATCKTQVFTSATLTTDGHFGFFKKRMGLPKETAELKLEPVFDYMQQALLYVPDDLPPPNTPDFVEQLVPTLERLVTITDGRALLLFTSYRNMNRAFELLAPKLDVTTLRQGDRSRNALLEDFREDTTSVLFATASFWEGVDVQGESLSLVCIDKLPFASPWDPLVKARLKHIEETGGHPFVDYQVPTAAITLKQGFGRLIRHRDDVGIIAILDQRLVKKGYGKRFLNSLPRARRTRDLDVVARWWAAKTGAGEASPNSESE